MTLQAVEPRNFQEDLERAIISTDLPKVSRLLTRKRKLSLARFNDMLGWADDMIEDRKLLTRTVKESLLTILAIVSASITIPVSLIYYFDVGHARMNMDTLLGSTDLLFTATKATGILSLFALYKAWIGPRYRLQNAYLVRYEIEDQIETLERKIKEQKAREIVQKEHKEGV